MFPDLSLTTREAAFVVEYCGRANANATEAAKLAGYGGPHVTRASLQMTGSGLLRRPKIKKALLKRWDELTAPSEEILKRMTDDARLDVQGLLRVGDGGIVLLDLTPETLERYGPLIREIETDPETGAIVRVKLNDSQAARRDLARIRRLFSDSPIINIFNLQDVTNDELQKRISATRAQLVGPVRVDAAFSDGDGGGGGNGGRGRRTGTAVAT